MHDLTELLVLLFSGICLYVCLLQWHYPRKTVTKELREQIKRNGLLHFTTKENAINICKEGIRLEKERPMQKRERGMVWTYLYDVNAYQTAIGEIHKKGDRKNYDAAVFIRKVTDEQLDKMTYKTVHRGELKVIAHRGMLKTEDMSWKCIDV